MPSDPTLPVSVEGVGELPDEIVRAIEALCDAEHRSGAAYFGGSRECDQRAKDADAANDALTTAILSRLASAERCCDSYARENQQFHDRLTAAEAARDEARADQKAAEDANEALEVKLRALAPHGSCACSYDSPDDVCMHHSPALSAALSRAERAEKALDFYRSAAVTSCTMEGLHYQGVSSSMFRHAWEADRAALIQPAPTEDGSHGAS